MIQQHSHDMIHKFIITLSVMRAQTEKHAAVLK